MNSLSQPESVQGEGEYRYHLTIFSSSHGSFNTQPKDGNQKLTTPEVETPILYSHPECDFSNMLKEELDEEGVNYTEIDMSLHEDKWAELEKLTGGDRTTPVLIRNGEVEVGYHGIG